MTNRIGLAALLAGIGWSESAIDIVSRVPEHVTPTRRVSSLKPGQGRKYSGATLRELRAVRGVGSVRRIAAPRGPGGAHDAG